MEGVSIIIPVFNKLAITKECIVHIKELNKNCALEIVIVDNGSTDGTPEVLSSDRGITYIRNQKNLGISEACNHVSNVARYDVLCFMHNDLFVFEKDWVCKIREFISNTQKTGVVGLYGAKTLRKDGSFRGKTIVHSKKGSPSTGTLERVAVVDGLLMAIQGTVFKRIGGFNELFPIHYYDKDISLRSLMNNYDNYILPISFEHRCATTRKEIEDDNKIRNAAQRKFLEIWNDFLPVDTSTWRERLLYIFKNI